MSEPVTKDAEWLKGKLIELLEDASAQDPKDHAACAKYADLLFKVLPRGEGKQAQDGLEAVRKEISARAKPSVGSGGDPKPVAGAKASTPG